MQIDVNAVPDRKFKFIKRNVSLVGRRLFASRFANVVVLFCVLATTATACSDHANLNPAILLAEAKETQALPRNETTASAGQAASITGVRLSQGNAVDCPQLRDDAGKIHVVSYLSPAAPIGTRVTVSGTYGITTKCLGSVLVVDQEVILSE